MASAPLTHNQIWTALDRLAARAGLSPSGLAKSRARPDHFQQVETHHAGRAGALAFDQVGGKVAGGDQQSIETFVPLIAGAMARREPCR